MQAPGSRDDCLVVEALERRMGTKQPPEKLLQVGWQQHIFLLIASSTPASPSSSSTPPLNKTPEGCRSPHSHRDHTEVASVDTGSPGRLVGRYMNLSPPRHPHAVIESIYHLKWRSSTSRPGANKRAAAGNVVEKEVDCGRLNQPRPTTGTGQRAKRHGGAYTVRGIDINIISKLFRVEK